jgi:calcineurin-like phosphoesterase family protein
MEWFSADLHLSHKNIIEYCNRPFTTTVQMDSTIINNFGCVKPGHTLYLLGDLSFDEQVAANFLDMLSGVNIVFIKGNHDSKRLQKIIKNRNIPLYALYDTNINGQPITMCHYAMRVWSKSHYNAWQVYGHSHATLMPQGKQYDVGVDNNGFMPVSWEKLRDIMNNSPNNLNYIKE